MEFYGYRKCSTCRNAHRHLTAAGHDVVFHDFVESPPDTKTLERWVAKRGAGIAPFLNTKGKRFKELGLAVDTYTDTAWLAHLSQDGRLLKRPVLELDDQVLVGYQASAYDEVIQGIQRG